jgi:hypothetical protein
MRRLIHFLGLTATLALYACGSPEPPLTPTPLGQASDPPSHQAGSGQRIQTALLSPSVFAAINSRGPALELAVLWRGAPRWYLGCCSRSGHSSGNATGFSMTEHFPAVDLTLTYDYGSRAAILNGHRVVLPVGTNVVLVDGVDDVLSIAGVTGVDSKLPETWTPASLLVRSAEVVSFLRCNAAPGNPSEDGLLYGLICE